MTGNPYPPARLSETQTNEFIARVLKAADLLNDRHLAHLMETLQTTLRARRSGQTGCSTTDLRA